MKVIWMDCETGGLDPAAHDITQIAGIIEIDGKVREEFELLMRPDHPSRVTQEALDVTGLTLEQVLAHPLTQAEGYLKLIGYLGQYVNRYDKNDKFVWAGQTAKFDMDFVRALFKKNGDKYFGSYFNHSAADLIALTMAMKLRGYYPGLPNLRLGSIASAVGVDFKAHRATEDIRATRECFYRIAERIMPVGAP